jgi:CHRD domain
MDEGLALRPPAGGGQRAAGGVTGGPTHREEATGPMRLMRPMRRRAAALLGLGGLGLVVVLGVALGVGAPAPALGQGQQGQQGQQGPGQFRASLTGFQEVPAISTKGQAELRLRLRDSSTLEFELRYSNLEGGNPSAAHIHLGQRGVNGAVVVFFCGGGGKPACPASTSGTVTGTIVPADIQVVPAQGIAANEFDELVAAIRAGVTYANIHNSTYGSGEIRGQIGRGDGQGGGGDREGNND